ncbi:MAG: carbon-nitrogen hydrolase family protein [Chloroflexi bacterium]|nr:carbon-nitrogen hydrolase family protein [Chloroflexota bacterium]
MRATITQIDPSHLESQWQALRHHVQMAHSQLVLLPEMCFAPWFCTTPRPDEARWRDVVDSHDQWLRRLPGLAAQAIVGTAPRLLGEKKRNVAYIWTRSAGLRWDHQKTYLPNDDGYWEANWYDRASVDFQCTSIGATRAGIMICTEIWFMQHARAYSRQGIHLLLNPRSTPLGTNDKWLAGGRTAAVVSGAFCLSSNHAGRTGHIELGGAGWICDPDGAVLAVTSPDQPFVTLDLDLRLAQAAKSTYPRYVDDSPL